MKKIRQARISINPSNIQKKIAFQYELKYFCISIWKKRKKNFF